MDQEGGAAVDPGGPEGPGGPGEVVQVVVLPSPEMETETMAERVQHKLTKAKPAFSQGKRSQRIEPSSLLFLIYVAFPNSR